MNNKIIAQPEFWNLHDLAELMGVTTVALRAAVKDGRITPDKIVAGEKRQQLLFKPGREEEVYKLPQLWRDQIVDYIGGNPGKPCGGRIHISGTENTGGILIIKDDADTRMIIRNNLGDLRSQGHHDVWAEFSRDEQDNTYITLYNLTAEGAKGETELKSFYLVKEGEVLAQRWKGTDSNNSPILKIPSEYEKHRQTLYGWAENDVRAIVGVIRQNIKGKKIIEISDDDINRIYREVASLLPNYADDPQAVKDKIYSIYSQLINARTTYKDIFKRLAASCVASCDPGSQYLWNYHLPSDHVRGHFLPLVKITQVTIEQIKQAIGTEDDTLAAAIISDLETRGYIDQDTHLPRHVDVILNAQTMLSTEEAFSEYASPLLQMLRSHITIYEFADSEQPRLVPSLYKKQEYALAPENLEIVRLSIDPDDRVSLYETQARISYIDRYTHHASGPASLIPEIIAARKKLEEMDQVSSVRSKLTALRNINKLAQDIFFTINNAQPDHVLTALKNLRGAIAAVDSDNREQWQTAYSQFAASADLLSEKRNFEMAFSGSTNQYVTRNSILAEYIEHTGRHITPREKEITPQIVYDIAAQPNCVPVMFGYNIFEMLHASAETRARIDQQIEDIVLDRRELTLAEIKYIFVFIKDFEARAANNKLEQYSATHHIEPAVLANLSDIMRGLFISRHMCAHFDKRFIHEDFSIKTFNMFKKYLIAIKPSVPIDDFRKIRNIVVQDLCLQMLQTNMLGLQKPEIVGSCAKEPGQKRIYRLIRRMLPPKQATELIIALDNITNGVICCNTLSEHTAIARNPDLSRDARLLSRIYLNMSLNNLSVYLLAEDYSHDNQNYLQDNPGLLLSREIRGLLTKYYAEATSGSQPIISNPVMQEHLQSQIDRLPSQIEINAFFSGLINVPLLADISSAMQSMSRPGFEQLNIETNRDQIRLQLEQFKEFRHKVEKDYTTSKKKNRPYDDDYLFDIAYATAFRQCKQYERDSARLKKDTSRHFDRLKKV